MNTNCTSYVFCIAVAVAVAFDPIARAVDSDGDLLPDDWELRYQFPVSQNVGEALLGHWPMDDSGPYWVTDLGQLSLHGHLGSPNQTRFLGNSMMFSSEAQDVITFDNVSAFDLPAGFRLSLFYQPQATDVLGNHQLARWGPGASGEAWELRIAQGGTVELEFVHPGGATSEYLSGGSIAWDAQWPHEIVASFDVATNMASLSLDGGTPTIGTLSQPWYATTSGSFQLGGAASPVQWFVLDNVHLFRLGSDTLPDTYGDPDQDTLINLTEYQAGTNPRRNDTDNDGIPDAWEMANGLSPVNPADAGLDSDGDGLNNYGEYLLRDHPGETGSGDFDGDDMPNGWEAQYRLNPASANDAGADADGDSVSNHQEYLDGTNPRFPGADTDGDGMPDAWEASWGFNPNDPSDANGDADGDGLSNVDEFAAGTSPRGVFLYEDLGAITGGDVVWAAVSGANASGAVAINRYSVTAGVGITDVALRAGGGTTILPGLSEGPSWAVGISDSGVVAGSSLDSSGMSHAVAWIGGAVQQVPLSDTSSSVLGISANGTILGSWYDGSGVYRWFLWDTASQSAYEPSTNGYEWTSWVAITRSGNLLGICGDGSGNEYVQLGGMTWPRTDLGSGFGLFSPSRANDSGAILGFIPYGGPNENIQGHCVFQNYILRAVYIDYYQNGNESVADIDSANRVAGGAISANSNGARHAFLWRDGYFLDLDVHAFNKPAGVTITDARFLPGNGTIVGEADHSGILHAMRLVEVLDSDEDGLSDDLETYYGFNPNNASDATADFDQDGINNRDEILHGLNPLLPAIDDPSGQYVQMNVFTPLSVAN